MTPEVQNIVRSHLRRAFYERRSAKPHRQTQICNREKGDREPSPVPSKPKFVAKEISMQNNYCLHTEAGEGRLKIAVDAIRCGKDLTVTITGGTEAHVGAVALGCGRVPGVDKMQYSASVSCFCVPDHKDDFVARKVAKQLADAIQANVVVSCGIHIDDATQEELILLQNNVEEAVNNLLSKLT